MDVTPAVGIGAQILLEARGREWLGSTVFVLRLLLPAVKSRDEAKCAGIISLLTGQDAEFKTFVSNLEKPAA